MRIFLLGFDNLDISLWVIFALVRIFLLGFDNLDISLWVIFGVCLFCFFLCLCLLGLVFVYLVECG